MNFCLDFICFTHTRSARDSVCFTHGQEGDSVAAAAIGQSKSKHIFAMKPYIFLTSITPGFDSPPAHHIFKIFFLVKIISLLQEALQPVKVQGAFFFNGVGSRGTLAAGATATATLM